ncbi:maleylacetoacetate isomerase [Sphingosinithalassobacter sp. CS137]|uniref:maleylacetoacetate isomerase n=1 Tax=Sphingosinithalassobacter sp. CS137 TaxID=2762748 RepID=UPI00165D9C78|nr:maleylacetoacetate isomerase [Sphingosinithalassobacter sp. CS137]
MILHDYYRSSASYRVRIALNLKGIVHERRAISLLNGEQRTPEHLERNPQGFVPALETDDGLILTQSLAIIEWLDLRYPEPRLIPAEPDARAAALARAMVIGMDIHPLNNLRVLRWLTQELEIGEPRRTEWIHHWIGEGFAALEAMAGEGPFLGGDRPDIADVFLTPQLYNARRFEAPLDSYPKLLRAEAAAAELPAFADAHPDAVKPD